MYSGLFLGLIISQLIDWGSMSLPQWILVHWAALAPTLLQVRFQFKWFKVISRTLLGIATTTYFISGFFFVNFFTPHLAFCLAMILVFALFCAAMLKFREIKTPNPCDDCPLGTFPTCEWNMPNVLAEIEDAEIRQALRDASPDDFKKVG